MNTIRTFEHITADCAEQAPVVTLMAQNEVCTAAVNLLWEYEVTAQPDPEAWAYLLSHICRMIPGYFLQTQYGLGRKLQALTAAISPKLFMHLKKAVRSLSKTE